MPVINVQDSVSRLELTSLSRAEKEELFSYLASGAYEIAPTIREGVYSIKATAAAVKPPPLSSMQHIKDPKLNGI